MASSRPVCVGSASHTSSKKFDSGTRETHIYKTTEEITVARVYEEDESGYAGIEGTFLDGSNAEQVASALVQCNKVSALCEHFTAPPLHSFVSSSIGD